MINRLIIPDYSMCKTTCHWLKCKDSHLITNKLMYVHVYIIVILFSIECDSACDQGLGFCTDSTNTSCCSFYDNDVCVSQCGTNKHSNESFDCVCNQFYNGADCTSKYYK